ncbi:MAG: MerR family transcriptional regulator [bacterium]|nr:MerR family transcriptional regulator [bacterium]
MITEQIEHLTIQQAAERTGLSVHTLRYYERVGLLAPVGRAANGHRRYAEIDLRRIEFLNKLRSTGMPIRQMRVFAALLEEGDTSIPERLALLQAHQETVRCYIEDLQRNLSAIDYKIQLYTEKLEGEHRKG